MMSRGECHDDNGYIVFFDFLLWLDLLVEV